MEFNYVLVPPVTRHCRKLSGNVIARLRKFTIVIKLTLGITRFIYGVYNHNDINIYRLLCCKTVPCIYLLLLSWYIWNNFKVIWWSKNLCLASMKRFSFQFSDWLPTGPQITIYIGSTSFGHWTTDFTTPAGVPGPLHHSPFYCKDSLLCNALGAVHPWQPC